MPDETKAPSKFLIAADTKTLSDKIDESAVSKRSIGSIGGVSTETISRALKGQRILRSKAAAIVKGISHHGVKIELSEVFIESE